MAHRVTAVYPGSIAEQCGIKVGDSLAEINGEPVLDQVDYQALTACESLILGLETAEGPMEIVLKKDVHEPLGLQFDSTLMSRPSLCRNRCIFCFVDQMPPGMRETLYVKDDDWRLSLMMGNYITLTNLNDEEFDRILKRRVSPLYISIHATDPALRKSMMANPKAGNILPQLRRLAEQGIRFHCQVVLCPGINDGPALDQTLQDLRALHPYARSVALVPVGLTRHREGLSPLQPYTRQQALAVLQQAQAWQERFRAELDTAFVFPADEFYCIAGHPLPPEESYEDYPQIENGVGLLRQFELEYCAAHRFADFPPSSNREILLATGVSAAGFLRDLLAKHPVPGVQVHVIPIKNCFFGETVTVAGLITGQDLLEQLKGQTADAIFIPQSMLNEDQRFLDDLSLEEVSRQLGQALLPIPCDGAALLEALSGMEDPNG